MRIKQFLVGDRGMSLVEVLVALVILSVGILTAMTMFTTSFKTSSDNRDQITAQNFANAIIEDYKARKSAINGQDKDFEPPVAPLKINSKVFTPAISVTYHKVNSASFAQIKVTVSWVSSRGVTKSVNRITRISVK